MHVGNDLRPPLSRCRNSLHYSPVQRSSHYWDLAAMSVWNFLGDIGELIDWIWHWRFTVPLLLGIALAYVAADYISAEPLRYIVAGAFVIAGVYIGWRWESAHG